MFKGPQETAWDNKSSSYSVFELPEVNCILTNNKISVNLSVNLSYIISKYNKCAELKSLKPDN